KTKLNNPEYPNAELYHDITIYNIPLRIDDSYLTWYKSDPNIPPSIPIVLYNEKTDEPLSYLDQEYTITVNGESDTMISPTYNYDININDLSYGDTNLNVTLSTDNTELMSLHKTITILSNFELPSKTIYYVNNTPDIYYKPKGNIAQNKQAKVNNTTYYTNANGLLHAIKDNKTIGNYTLTLVAASDGLSEERNFSYELKKPFIINRTSYNQYSQIVYAITFYDKEHVGWGSNQGVSFAPNPENFINIMNENNENISYTYTSNLTNDSITYYVTINKATNTVGTNTLTVEVNGYSETDIFEFSSYEHLYELITTETDVGQNKVLQIQCNDPNIHTVTISGTGIIKQNTITQTTDNVLLVSCNINKASPVGTRISMSYDDIIETSILKIQKGNISGKAFIGTSINSEHISSFSIDEAQEYGFYCNISFPISPRLQQRYVVSDGKNNYTRTSESLSQSARVYALKDVNCIPGTYMATLTYNGDSDFNSYTNSLAYTITAENCAITLDATNNFIDNINTSSTLTAQYIHNETPIQSATLTLTLNGNVVNTDTTNSNGQVVFTITEPGEYTVVAKSNNETMCTSNTITINGVVEESNTHIPNNIILESNKNFLSYVDNEAATLTATIYDQHGDKIKNKVVKFYIVNSKNYSVSLDNIEVL
ncbi:MAG: hypothetical protein IKF79_00085, partial [Methanosphaera sp.]|nr:hypothetical protein [Methanosphaera sp.]